MKRFFIDSENVGDFWIPLLALPAEDTELIVFYTKNSPHMSYESLIKLKESDRKVTFIKCYEGTNALDFQLCSELGYRLCMNEGDEFIIVTNDTGFDAAVKYWRHRKYPVRRITGKESRSFVKVTEKPADIKRDGTAGAMKEQSAAAGGSGTVRERSAGSAEAAEEVREESRGGTSLSSPAETEEFPDGLTRRPAAVPLEGTGTGPENLAAGPSEEPEEGFEGGKFAEEPSEESEGEPEEVSEGEEPAEELSEEFESGSGEEESFGEEGSGEEQSEEEGSGEEQSGEEPWERSAGRNGEGTPEGYGEVSEEEPSEGFEGSPEDLLGDFEEEEESEEEPGERQEETAEPDEEELTVIVSCIGLDNLAELHNQLIQFYSDNGKVFYQAIKNGTLKLPVQEWDKQEKFLYYCALIIRHSDLEPEYRTEESIRTLAEFLCGADSKRRNLNSLRYALIKKFGKETGRRYYFMIKPYVKAMNQM